MEGNTAVNMDTNTMQMLEHYSKEGNSEAAAQSLGPLKEVVLEQQQLEQQEQMKKMEESSNLIQGPTVISDVILAVSGPNVSTIPQNLLGDVSSSPRSPRHVRCGKCHRWKNASVQLSKINSRERPKYSHKSSCPGKCRSFKSCPTQFLKGHPNELRRRAGEAVEVDSDNEVIVENPVGDGALVTVGVELDVNGNPFPVTYSQAPTPEMSPIVTPSGVMTPTPSISTPMESKKKRKRTPKQIQLKIRDDRDAPGDEVDIIAQRGSKVQELKEYMIQRKLCYTGTLGISDFRIYDGENELKNQEEMQANLQGRVLISKISAILVKQDPEKIPPREIPVPELMPMAQLAQLAPMHDSHSADIAAMIPKLASIIPGMTIPVPMLVEHQAADSTDANALMHSGQLHPLSMPQLQITSSQNAAPIRTESNGDMMPQN